MMWQGSKEQSVSTAGNGMCVAHINMVVLGMSKACDEYAVAYGAAVEYYDRCLEEYEEHQKGEPNWVGSHGKREGFLRDCLGPCTEHAEVKQKAIAVVRSWAHVAIGRSLPGEIDRMIDEALPCRRTLGMKELSQYELAWNSAWSGPGFYWFSTLDWQGAYCSTDCGEFETPVSGRRLDGSTIEVVKWRWDSTSLVRNAVYVLYREEERGRERRRRRRRCDG